MRIDFIVATSRVKSIYVDGDEYSNIRQLINNYYNENGDLPVTLYKTEELTDKQLETFIPINGGEFWIEGISNIEMMKVYMIN